VLASRPVIPGFDLEPTVFIVDDDVSVRESLEMLIRQAGWRPEIFASAETFLAFPRNRAPRCLVLDVTLPHLSGLELQRRIAEDEPYMPIVFISGYGDVPTTVRAMKAGAFEFLTKPLAEDALLDAIREAVSRSRTALREEAALRALRDAYASLTAREKQVMALVTAGLLNKQIAGRLNISLITVKAHRGSVMRKMAVESLADLVKAAAALDADPAGAAR